MNEQKKENVATAKAEVKPEINYHALPDGNPYSKDVEVIETHPGFTAGSLDKFQVFVRVPFIKGKDYKAEDKICQDFYGCDFKTFLQIGSRGLSTRPAFKAIFKDDGTLPANGHKQLQDLMDGYRVGRVSDGTTVKEQKRVGGKVLSRMTENNISEAELDKAIADLIASKSKK